MPSAGDHIKVGYRSSVRMGTVIKASILDCVRAADVIKKCCAGLHQAPDLGGDAGSAGGQRGARPGRRHHRAHVRAPGHRQVRDDQYFSDVSWSFTIKTVNF